MGIVSSKPVFPVCSFGTDGQDSIECSPYADSQQFLNLNWAKIKLLRFHIAIIDNATFGLDWTFPPDLASIYMSLNHWDETRSKPF